MFEKPKYSKCDGCGEEFRIEWPASSVERDKLPMACPFCRKPYDDEFIEDKFSHVFITESGVSIDLSLYNDTRTMKPIYTYREDLTTLVVDAIDDAYDYYGDDESFEKSLTLFMNKINKAWDRHKEKRKEKSS